MRLGIFLVTNISHPNLNAIVSGSNRETAKEMAKGIFGGDSDQYVVTPIVQNGQRTIFAVVTESLEAN
jgi:hypothetical protein